MPNIITHYTFAKDKIEDPSPKFVNATFLGAQGPDPFFYYGAMGGIHRPNAKDINSLGGITQHMELTEPYYAMIEYAMKSPDKDLLLAYIDGLFMHYSLDRMVHPFVFFNTGFTDRPEDSSQDHHHYNFGHMYFENILDFIVGKKEGTFKRADRYLKLDNRSLHKISEMWEATNRQVQHISSITEDSYYLAVKDFRKIMRIAYSPLGVKKAFFKLIFGKESYPYGISAPHNLRRFEGIDFLNEKHAKWYTPSGNEKTQSFYDLYEEAGSLYRSLHACLLKAKNGYNEKKDIDIIGSGINHEGIIPNSPKIYWKLIWPESFFKDTIKHPTSPKEDY
jgi:hypothetical protein